MIQVRCANRFFSRAGRVLVVALALAALLWCLVAGSHLGYARAESNHALDSATGSKLSVDFAVRGVNGYAISVSATRGRIVLGAEARGSGGLATYTVPGRASQRGVRARFGSLGEVSVRFDPTRWTKRRRPPRGCRGKPSVQRFGFFRGKIVFRGEGGYTRVRHRRAKGSVTTRPRWRCGPREANLPDGPNIDFEHPPFDPDMAIPETPEVGVSTLSVKARRAGIEFGAVSFGDLGEDVFGSAGMFVATTAERRGRVRIQRLVFLFGGDVEITDEPESATVTPPKPFTGSSTFERHSDGNTSWTGNLRVSFPGREGVSLTDRRFTAALQRF